MTKQKKASLIARKIRSEFPDTPEANLMFAIIYQALKDAASVDAAHLTYAERESAIDYLQGDIPHAAICGVDSDYIKKVIKHVGL